MKRNKLIILISFYLSLIINTSNASTFEEWKKDFKLVALSKGISENTFQNDEGCEVFTKSY